MKKHGFIVAIIIAISTITMAQELTLNDCVDIALQNKETLNSAELDLQSAKAGKIGALSNILPSVSLSAGRSETSYANSDIYPTSSYWSAGIGVSQNIFDGGGWWNRIARANNGYVMQQQLERQVRTNVIAEVHRAYYQLLKSQQLVEVAGQNLDLAEQQVELSQRKYDLGAAKKTDLLKSKVAAGISKTALITQQGILYTAISELKNALGILDNGEQIVISREIEELQSIPEFVEAVETLKSNNPGILATEAQLKDAKINKKLTTAMRLPSLSASLSYGGTDSEFSGLSEALNDDWTMTTGLNLSFPIFSGMGLSTQSQQAKLAVQKQKNDLITATNDAIVYLETLHGIVSDYFKIIPINEEVLASAEEDMNLVSERYRLGSASILELLDAQVSVTQSRVGLVSSIYDAKIQEAYLKAQLGILDKEFDEN